LVDDTSRELVQSALNDRRFAKSSIEVHTGGVPGAIAHYQENTTPNVILLESDSDAETLLGQIDQLAEVCDAGTNVLVIGTANDIKLYRELTRRGVADYLVKPLQSNQLFEAISNVCLDPDAPPMGKVFSFIAGRGGAGSSTVAHNVANELAEVDEDVVVIDMDLDFGTAALAFNLEASSGVHSALSDPERLDEVLLERFLLEYSEKLSLLASPAKLDHNVPIMLEALEKLLDLVKRRAAYVVVDLPHRWAPWVERILLDSDEVCIISAMDLASLRDTKNLIDTLTKARGATSAPKLVLNHEGAYRRTELSAKDFESAVETKPSAVLPHDPILFGNAANNGQLLSEVNAKHKARELIRTLAFELSGRQAGAGKRAAGGGSLFSRLLKNKPKAAGKRAMQRA
jgi:pilus assembly protein CpaE